VNAIERFRSLVSELQPGVLRVCSAEGPLEGFAGAEATDRFKMASIRKLIVALLFGLMEERGLVHRSTRLRRFGLSDIRPMEDFSLEATMLQLLGCMSGVRHPAVGDPETDGDARSEQPVLSWGFGGQILLVLPATQRVMVSLMYTHRAAARRLAAAEVAALAEAAWLAFG